MPKKKQRTSYSIRVEFKSGIKKRWGLQIAISTFKHWKEDVEYFLPDDTSLKDAKKILAIARKNWPEYNYKIIRVVTIAEVLKY